MQRQRVAALGGGVGRGNAANRHDKPRATTLATPGGYAIAAHSSHASKPNGWDASLATLPSRQLSACTLRFAAYVAMRKRLDTLSRRESEW